LAPLHFRNQLNLLHHLFPTFQANVEATWRGLQVQELIGHGGKPGDSLDLEVRDGDFVAELALMGHGLQMWLQTMWFLTRATEATTIVLDEPDVYMHADLQRKLVRYVKDRFRQVIITTHSSEIMAEVAPENITVIDRSRSESVAADSLPTVQRVVASLGSTHNLHLTRLWSAQRFLIVEGDDLTILKALQNLLFPESTHPLDTIPNASIGGWGGWRFALGSSLVLENAAGKGILTYCILDSDFHAPGQIRELEEQFRKRAVQLHIWEMKELENYLLVPEVIRRAITRRLPRRGTPPDSGEIDKLIAHRATSMKEECLDGLAQEFGATDRSLGVAGANKHARAYLEERVRRVGMSGCVSGKLLLRGICEWAQEEFGVSLSAMYLAQQMTKSEVHPELVAVLSAIEECRKFS
jgi:hypothetical protein